MKNVTRSSFSSTTDIEPVTAGDIVYSGSWTIPANYTGWVEIELDNPFDYDGTSNLMVAMHEYTSGYSSRYFTYTDVTNSGLSYYSDSSNPNPYNLSSYSGSKYLRSYRANMQLEIIQGNLSCYSVRNLTASNITSESFTLSWVDTSNSGATYSVYTVTPTDTLVLQSGITDTFYDAYNLTGNTVYTFGVKADCGAGDESSMRYVSCRTSCVAISSLPFSYGFEDAATGTAAEFPACWHRINDATSTYNYYPYVNNSTSYVHTGVNGLYWYHTTTSTYANNEYAILPPVDLDVYSMSNLTLAFWAKTTSTSYHPQPIIGVMTDPTDATTFTAVDTFSATAITTAWQLFAVSLEDYAGTGNYIAIKWPRPSSTSYMAIDDIYLTDDWCDIPIAVSASSTAETVTLSWNANGGTSFTVFVGNDTVTNITDTFYTFTTLTPDTVYTYGVASECSTSISAFVEGSIRTQCLAISTFPWMQDFDAITSINDLNCWERFSGLYNDSASFTLTPTTSGWIMYSDHGMAGSQHMKVNVYSTTCRYWLMTPVFEISTGMELSFEYSLTTYASDNPIDADVTDDRFVVFAVTSDNTFVPLGKWGNDTTRDDYSYENIPNVATGFSTSLDQFTGENVRFAFYGESTVSGDDNDLHIDNVYVGAAATCPRTTSVWVSSVNPNGATINWEDTAHVGSYVVEYMPQGSTGTPLTETVTDTTVTLTGLTPNTPYEVNVRVNCGDLSLPRTVFFRTLCSYLDSLPYFENFDGVAGATSTSVAVNNLPPCWSNYNVGTSTSYSGYPIVYNSSTYAHSGAQAMRFYNYITAGTYADQYGIMPMTDSTEYPINALKVNFWMRANTTSYNSWVVVGVMTDPSDASTFVPVQTIYTNSSTTYANHNVNFGSYTGAHGCVAFKFPQPTSGYNYGYVDDVTLEVAPTCAPVVSHNVTATASAARITWDYDHDFAHGADSYEVSYGYASDNLVGATTVTVTDPIVVLTALDADTTYKVSIQPICTDGTASAHVFNFNTAALPCAEWDTTGFGGPTDTLVVGTPGTSTTNVMPVNTGYNYSYCQHLILASHLPSTGPQTFSGIGFDYAYSSPMTHANNCQIYMGHTTRSDMTSTDSTFVPYSQLTLVYQGPLNCTASGWNYFEFNQGVFAYNGTSNIVVAIVNNSGATNSSAVFRYEQVSVAMSHRVYNNATPYDATSMDAARAGGSFWRSNMKLLTGGGECILQASCYAPSVAVQQDDEGDVEVTWLPGYQEPSWNLDYKAGDTGSWVNVLTGTNLTSYTFPLASLVPNTHYTFRVTPNCTDTVLSGTASFLTPCGLFSVPFSEDFESFSTTAANPLPNCWNKHTNYSTNYPNGSTSYNHGTGTKSMYMYSTNTTYSYMVLPQFNLPIDSTVVSFWLYKSNTSYAHNLSVGVMTDPDDVNTFVEVAQVVPTLSSTWEPFEVSLHTYTGTGRYIAIMSPNGVYSYPYLDDLMVDRRSSCPRVENVTAYNITQTSATISWDSTSADSYFVEYGPAGFTPGAGTVVSVSGADSVDITGLTASTAYEVYVRGLCGSDTSAWSYVEGFYTACDVITTLPYIENFDNITGSTVTSPVPAGFLPPCWNIYNDGTRTNYQYSPYVYNGSTYAHSGSNCIRFYSYNSSGDSNQYLIMPPVDTTLFPVNTLQLSFWLRGNSASTNYFANVVVGVMTDATVESSFIPYDTINYASTTYANFEVNFNHYNGPQGRITMLFPKPLSSSQYEYGYVDDVMLGPLPTCPHVTNVTVDMVTYESLAISWNAGGTETQWVVSSDGTTWTSCADSSYIFTGLTASTMYTFYVRPVCGVGDTGYSQSISARTTCSYTTLPYSENFDAIPATTYSTAGVLPPCWQGYTNGTNDIYTPHVVGSGSYWYATTVNSMIMTSGSATYGDVKMVRLPVFDQPVNTLTMSFWMSTESSTNGYLCVGYMTGQNFQTDFVTVDSIHASSTTYHGSSSGLSANGFRDTVSFQNAPANAMYIAFKWVYTSSFYSCCIDDVEVTSTGASCATPSVTILSHTYESAVIRATGNGNSFELNYGTDPSVMPNTLTSTTGDFSISNLQPATHYFFRVRQECDSNMVSDWAEGNFFTDSLPCMPVTNIQINGSSYNSVTVGWTPVGDEHAWEVRVASTVDTHFASSQVPTVTVYNLVPQRLYNVNVRPLCGASGTVAGPWCDTIVTFTTDACTPVTNVNVSDITASSATVSWTAPAVATNFRVLYGFHDFDVNGEIESFNTTSNPFALTGLEANTPYTVRVAVICTESLLSSFTSADFTTANVGIFSADNDGALSLYPNPASTTVTLRVSEQLAGSTISIVDVNGRVVMSKTIAGETLTIDLNDVAKGAYFVRLTGEQSTVVRKLIVK
jgi:hypothetical protein